MSFLLTKYR